MKNKHRGFSPLVVIAAVVILVGVAAGAYLLGKNQNETNIQQAEQINEDDQVTKIATSSKSTVKVSQVVDEITVDELFNVSYSPSPTEKFTFKNGTYYFEYLEGKAGTNQVTDYPNPNYFISMGKNVSFGDINGDSKNDAVVGMGESYGGTGHFKSLAVFVNQGGKPQYIGRKELGDRIIIESVKIENGIIIANLVTHDSGEPLCCPTTKKTIKFRLVNGQLVDVN